jgi:hypothetical protein
LAQYDHQALQFIALPAAGTIHLPRVPGAVKSRTIGLMTLAAWKIQALGAQLFQ